ncbi:hypothetical protein KMZ32_01875 [Phycicoccus sp. MAQZ13P-2]|uniref:hypothetical protein n=1 Tax=Phycicoccus mangrovi TaxID=2840470 RepID=UPI001C0063F4|nr:hypothetical protein [Phycicoccus mangrovi]MBT9254441.1 hypothetical protein [Phycicoccus mangrovi]MBT9272819.1 hypothetical protein [Phycicoccus mangrovi]
MSEDLTSSVPCGRTSCGNPTDWSNTVQVAGYTADGGLIAVELWMCDEHRFGGAR